MGQDMGGEDWKFCNSAQRMEFWYMHGVLCDDEVWDVLEFY